MAGYIKEAQQRAQRRKSPWNLLLIPFAIIGIAAVCLGMTQLGLLLRLAQIPSDAMWSGSTNVGELLRILFPFFPAIGFGLLFANLAVFLITPVRRILDREAVTVPGASFREAMRTLSLFTIGALVISLPFWALGSLTYFYVRPDGIHYHPAFAFSTRQYAWSQIQTVHTSCLNNRGALNLSFDVTMQDGTTLDLISDKPKKFLIVFPQIKSYLTSQPHLQYTSEITPSGIAALRNVYGTNARAFLEMLQTGQQSKLNGGAIPTAPERPTPTRVWVIIALALLYIVGAQAHQYLRKRNPNMKA